VCKHMPSAAIDSGMVSPVDLYTGEIVRLSALFPFEDRPTEEYGYGLTRLRAWLSDRGERHSEGFVKALQKEWLRDGMRMESKK